MKSFTFVFVVWAVVLSACGSDVGESAIDAQVNEAVKGFQESRPCGDGLVSANDGEVCDDGNEHNGDGCDENCEIEEGFECRGMSPSVCDSY